MATVSAASPSATSRAASAVLVAGRISAHGRCSRRKRWHCAVATGIDSTTLTSSSAGPAGAGEAVLDVEDHLALDQQVVVERQRVLGEVDDALDRVLDRHDTAVDVTRRRRRRARPAPTGRRRAPGRPDRAASARPARCSCRTARRSRPAARCSQVAWSGSLVMAREAIGAAAPPARWDRTGRLAAWRVDEPALRALLDDLTAGRRQRRRGRAPAAAAAVRRRRRRPRRPPPRAAPGDAGGRVRAGQDARAVRAHRRRAARPRRPRRCC